MKSRFWWLLLLQLALAQVRVGEWRTLTSPLRINAITAAGDTLVCGTDGGLLLFQPAQHTFSVLTNRDGLTVTRINSVFRDLHRTLWLTGDGVIQVYDLDSRQSLENFDFDLDAVIGFVLFKGVIYGAYRKGNKWGIAEFIYSEGQYYYRDLYERSGLNLIAGIAVHGDSLYLGTDRGILAGNPHRNHLAFWNNPFPGIEDTVRILKEKNGELVFVEKNNLYSLKGQNATPVLLMTDSRLGRLKDLAISDDGNYVAITDSVVYRLGGDQIEPLVLNSPFRFQTLFLSESGELFYGSEMGILRNNNGLYLEAPEAPVVGNPSAAALLSDGSLVLANSEGLSRWKGGEWENWIIHFPANVQNKGPLKLFSFPYSLGQSVPMVLEDDSGLLFAAVSGSSLKEGGGGIIQVQAFSDPIEVGRIHSATLPVFVTATNDSLFQVQDLALDRQGNLWAVSINSSDAPLHVFDGNEWKNLTLSESNFTLCRSVTALAVDNFGRLWIGARHDDSLNVGLPRNGGLTMAKIDARSGIAGVETWVGEDLSFGSGMETVLDLAVNPQNRLYILTPAGLIYKDLQISSEQPVRITGPLSTNGQLYPYFPNVAFPGGSRVKIDPRGNSWVTSPTDGIRVLLANGEYWPDVNGLTAENSELISNAVTDLTFDERKGLAYITTDRGVSVIKIPFAQRKKNYSQVSVFPSPFHIPSDRPLVIDGLKDHSTVVIMELNGRVIRSIKENSEQIHGYQAFWDGRNKRGHWVASGVYLVAVHDNKGNVDYEKITVIRH